jgi:Fe-S-cluster containining protein
MRLSGAATTNPDPDRPRLGGTGALPGKEAPTMDQTQGKARVEPVQLSRDSRIHFRCGKDLPCYTQCCRGLDLVLTPYDIIRLKKRVGLPSDEFLAIYTKPELLFQTDLPVPTLRLLDDPEQSCPFVREEGCLVYTDRPTACRYYPVGAATMRRQYADQSEEWFFLVKEPHCKGHDCPDEWSIQEWRDDQGAKEYDQINAPWYDLVVRKRSIPPNVKFSEKAKAMFYMASYNLDHFRRFVFESSFLEVFPLPPEKAEEVRRDDVALLRLGCEWLKGVMFRHGDMQVGEEHARRRMEKRGKAK